MTFGARVVLILTLAILVSAAPSAAKTRTQVLSTDDWPADSMINPGRMFCSGEEIVWIDPVTPTCPKTGQLHLRRFVGYGCTQGQKTGSGDPEPRMTGTVEFIVNGNLDAEHAGPVWGTWRTVPGECDPARLGDPELPYWKGVWQGRRSKFCGVDGCRWIGDLNLVGRGRGSLKGLHFKGTETITTFTPLPIPWELIGLCPPCGPEGVIVGTIKE
jgi:hypothetical protein